MRCFLGIDGGGTTTRAALLDSRGKVLGVGQAGGSNYQNVGLEAAKANLVAATRAAWRDAGREIEPAHAAFLGLAGVKASIDIREMKAAAESANLAEPGRIDVANDLHNALSGGLGGEPGIALIAGTGMNCLGRDATGETFMCGGWGWLMGDEGAGFGLAAEGLRAAARSADKREPPTRLLEAALAYFGASEPDALLARLYTGEWSPAAVAGFAPVVMRLAEDDDPAAQGVLKGGARALAILVVTTLRRLRFEEVADVVLLGGCLTADGLYRREVEAAIRASTPQARIRQPRHDTLWGAAFNALRTSGIEKTITPTFPNQ